MISSRHSSQVFCFWTSTRFFAHQSASDVTIRSIGKMAGSCFGDTVKRIPLTKGYEAIVDDGDYEWLSKYKWWAVVAHHTVYAVRQMGRKTIYMHREIMGASNNVDVDHCDGNGLHNRKNNLRLATAAQNRQNSKVCKDNTSGYKGIFKKCRKYRARIHVDGHTIYLGYFDNAEDAAKAYDSAAKKYFGPFAKTNF